MTRFAICFAICCDVGEWRGWPPQAAGTTHRVRSSGAETRKDAISLTFCRNSPINGESGLRSGQEGLRKRAEGGRAFHGVDKPDAHIESAAAARLLRHPAEEPR